ncbi:MAG: hypothetical protein AMJ43_03560 [Coxiella sp. DG_40]|nr:MAG: hypothetical protein AMJ43_03560 [Coxiella sp. DG_40]
METILNMQNPHWDNKLYSDLFSRSALQSLIKKLRLKEIHILLGVRRAGKSTLFQLLINHLMQTEDSKSILYLNLDDPIYHDVWHNAKELYTVVALAEKITGIKPKYLFLDEAQNVKAWERFVKSTYDSKLFKKIFVTGSNSSLLHGNHAKLLSGRYITDYIYPLSFKEILTNTGISTYLELINNKPQTMQLMEDMLFYGAFPRIFAIKNTELKREVLLSYYETIVLKDCIFNNNIRETKLMRDLAIYMLTNSGTLYSYNNVAKIFTSNENTIKEFIHVFVNAFLINEIKNFSYSLKTQTKSKKKAFCIDNGLVQVVSVKFSENKGKLFENLIYAELKKSNFQEIYFFNDPKECDFIVKKDDKLIAIQACFTIDTLNRTREITGLKTVMQKFNIDKGIIITFNQEEVIDKHIIITPFWKIFFNLDFR